MASEVVKKKILVTDSEKEFRLERYPDVSVITENKINCTVCFKDIKHVILLKEKLYEHIFLNVVLCKGCSEFYGNGNFSSDEDGEKYCGWCGQGGNLYICSKCPIAFCKKCLKGNLGRKHIKNVESSDWQCLFCKPKPLYDLRALCWAVNKYLTKQKNESKAKAVRTSRAKKSSLDLTVVNPNENYSNELESAKRQYAKHIIKIISLSSKFESNLADLKSLKTLKEFSDLSNAIDINLNTNIRELKNTKHSISNSLSQLQRQLVKKYKKIDEVVIIESDQETDKISSLLDNTQSCADISVINDSLCKMDPINESLVDSNEAQVENELVTINNINIRADLFSSINDDSINDVINETLSETGVERMSFNTEKTTRKENGNNPNSPDNDFFSTDPLVTADPVSKSFLNSSEDPLALSDTENKEKEEKQKTEGRKTSSEKSSSCLLDSSSTDPLDSSDDENKEIVKQEKKVKKGKKMRKKSDIKTDKSDDINLSSSDDEFKNLLNISFRKKKRESQSGSSADSNKSSENVNKKKIKRQKESELSLVDCLDGSMDEIINNSDVNSFDFAPVFEFDRNDDARINDTLLSDSEKSHSESNDLSSIFLDDENDKKRKETVKKEKRKIQETDGVEKERTKHYKDSVLSFKLTEENKSEEEKKGANKDLKKTLIKSSATSSSDEEPTTKKKVVSSKAGKLKKKLFSNSEGSSFSDIESESSSDHNDPEEEKSEDSDSNKKNKKRKRIQALASGSDDSSEGPKKKKDLTDSDKKGRKNIRKVLDEDNLKASTQAALKEEQERKKRIAEKQKIYNKMMEITANETTELKEVVLDFDATTKKPLLMVDSELVKKLKPHQAQGIKFMWDSCFESLKDAKKGKGSGCILAHCMGLGKTLQVITLLHTILTNKQCNVNTALIVAPVSTVLNWVSEFQKWLNDIGSGEDVEVFHIHKGDAPYRSHQLEEWRRCGGVMIMGYNLFRSLVNPPARTKKAFKTVYNKTLLDPGPDIVICDEGHILKNESTAISKAMTRIKSLRRIVLTGTPLQNNLVEYHCMVQFVKPSLLGTKKEFKNRFVNPIQNGQFEDSTSRDVKIMQRRAHVLHAMLDGIVQRKDYNVLTPYLPPKFEYVLHLRLTDLQCKLYRFYLDNVIQTNDLLKKRLFSDFQSLMRICLHPRALLMKSEKDEEKELKTDDDEEGSLKDFIDDDDDESSDSSKSSLSVSSSNSGSSSHAAKPVSRRCTRRTKAEDIVEEEEVPEEKKEWWSDMVDKEALDDIAQSSKLFMLFKILKYCEEIGDKLLIFSQSLYTLDIIEYFLDKIDSGSIESEFNCRWIKGADYYRLDGSTPSELRLKWCKSFNKESSTRARLFLISTRAGGLGINLTGANRVILYDASWNPSYDVQSIFRVFRFGQIKPCYIYRFLSKGTMEEKIYERQVAKLSTALRVIDEHQIDRHFSHSALAELYTFDPEASELQGTPILPKDRVMAELFQNHKDIILSYHQHDSLLENKEDQELSEAERKAAWDEYENEKNPPPMMSGMGMNMGYMFSDPVQQKTYSQLLLINDLEIKLKRQIPNLTKEEMDERIFGVLQSFPDYQITLEQFMLLRSQLLAVQSTNVSSFQSNTGTTAPMMQQPIRGAFGMPSTSYPTQNLNFANAANFRGGTSMVRNPIRNANPPFGQNINNQKGVNKINIQNSAANNMQPRKMVTQSKLMPFNLPKK